MNFFDGIDFICCGKSMASKKPIKRTFRDYYGVQYCHENEFFVKTKNSAGKTFSGSTALLTHPGICFTYGPPPRTTSVASHLFICFKGSRADEYIRSGLLPIDNSGPVIRITRTELFNETMLKLIELTSPLDPDHYPRAVNLLENLLLQLHNQPVLNNRLPEHLRTPLNTLINDLKKRPEQPWDFEREAQTFGMSYSTFRHAFKMHCDLPPGKFLTRERMKKAATLLRNSDRQISEVAIQCGFADSFYFSRLFKNHYHFAPQRYRREFRGC